MHVTVRAAYKVNDEAVIRNKSLTKAQLRRAMGSLDKAQAVYGLFVWGECVCTLRLVLIDVSYAQAPTTQLSRRMVNTGTERRFSTLLISWLVGKDTSGAPLARHLQTSVWMTPVCDQLISPRLLTQAGVNLTS